MFLSAYYAIKHQVYLSFVACAFFLDGKSSGAIVAENEHAVYNPKS
jgi:hypothetical protein